MICQTQKTKIMLNASTHGSGVGTRWFLWSPSTLNILWFYELWFISVFSFKNSFCSIPTEMKQCLCSTSVTQDCLIWEWKLIFLHHEILSETTDYVKKSISLWAKEWKQFSLWPICSEIYFKCCFLILLPQFSSLKKRL